MTCKSVCVRVYKHHSTLIPAYACGRAVPDDGSQLGEAAGSHDQRHSKPLRDVVDACSVVQSTERGTRVRTAGVTVASTLTWR